MIRKALAFAQMIWRTYILRDEVAVALSNWFKHGGDETLRLEYPLTAASVVFDVGGYMGDWSDQIARRYSPHIFIFEPVPEYYSAIKKRFFSNEKIKVHNYGLSDKTEMRFISVLEDGSSLFRDGSNRTEIALVDIFEYLAKQNIQWIDLIKLNIEGGEYPLLTRMINTDIVEKCRDIQIQFHNCVPDAEAMRLHIRNALSRTHFLTYDYPFVWENWRRKKQPQ